MASLLSPSGRLVCLEFPTDKGPLAGGPPFPVSPDVYVGHLGRPGEDLHYDEKGLIQFDRDDCPKSGGLERIAHWQPARSHAAGRGSDWLSVWKHAG